MNGRKLITSTKCFVRRVACEQAAQVEASRAQSGFKHHPRPQTALG